MRTYPELSNFEEIVPKNLIPQETALKWMADAHCRADNIINGMPVDRTDRLAFFEKLLSRYGVSPNKISARGSEVNDPLVDWSKCEIYKLTQPADNPRGADIRSRTHYFAERAYDIFNRFYPQNNVAPDHIIHVTCTGYISPSGPQRIVSDRQWNELTAVTHAYHMGCYASLPGVRMAEGLVGSLDIKKNGRNVTVDVVHTEMCSLHMDPSDHSPEQLVFLGGK